MTAKVHHIADDRQRATGGRTPPDPGRSALDDLLPALKRLDDRIASALAAVKAADDPGTSANLYRGLYISSQEAERLLSREPGSSVLYKSREDPGASSTSPMENDSQLTRLQRMFRLSPFDLDLILVALAPELDLRYENLYAYLQNDVTKKRPSVDLALNLLCGSAHEKLARRGHLTTEAPLIRQGLIHLIPDPQQLQPVLLAHHLKVDEQIVRLVLGQVSLDSRLAAFVQRVAPPESHETSPSLFEFAQALPGMVKQAEEEQRPVRFYFNGPPGSGKREVAAALAERLNAQLIVVDLAQLSVSGIELGQTFKLIFREAWLLDGVLYLAGLDRIKPEDQNRAWRCLVDALIEQRGILILAGSRPMRPTTREPLGFTEVLFTRPDFHQRRAYWQYDLYRAGVRLEGHELDALAGRFGLTSGQIGEAVATARNQMLWRMARQSAAVLDDSLQRPTDSRVTLDDLFQAARAQSSRDLETLAHKVEPRHNWDDIVLPKDTRQQLLEIGLRVAHRHRVLNDWGFERKLTLGKGVSALFVGPSGTGKTMAAEIIANDLKLDLYKIDLSSVVSKYIGETEKNLNRIFAAAEEANAILFFDEADALFGKRSEVRDAHDRYANIEISYLLQKMEEYEGLAILTTNLRQNLDQAFLRRLAYTVHFPFPDIPSRQQIWAGIWPPQTPLGDDVDLNFLAREYKLSGGNIKNLALTAAYLAVADGGPVTMAHLIQALRREYQKMGKVLSDSEIQDFVGK